MSVASVWMDRAKFEEAELQFHAYNAGTAAAADAAAPVVEESSGGNVNDLVSKLQTENSALKQQVADLTSKFAALDARLASIEGKMGAPAAAAPAPVKQEEPADDM